MTGTSLKLVMMILMVFDHIGPFISSDLASLFHLLTRPVAPVFAYMAVEGFIHTRNREKYLGRLYLSALVMTLGNILVNKYLIIKLDYQIHNNIFFTLALGVTALYIYENFMLKDKKLTGGILIFLIFAASIFAEGGIFIIPFMLIAYMFRENTGKRNLIYLVLTLILASGSIVRYESLAETLRMVGFNSDFLIFVAGLPFIYLYNGKRGLSNKFTKYMFYVFYPLHLWTIGILASKLL